MSRSSEGEAGGQMDGIAWIAAKSSVETAVEHRRGNSNTEDFNVKLSRKF